MMRAVGIIIIAVMLMKTTPGLPHDCANYCNFSPQKTFIPPGCDCSLYNLKITSSTASKHTATLPDDEHTVYMPSIIPTVKTQKKLTGANTGKSFIEQDVTDNKSYNQIKKRYTYVPQLLNERQELPLHLFLDIDITSENSNSPQLEELKNMFESFQAAEKNLSGCIDLHIYIFSKSIGGRVPNDNLSSIRQLTEIENKCDQLVSIIKKSIYQIKQSLTREDNTTELAQDGQDTVNTADSNKGTDAEYATNEFGHGNTATSDMYHNALATNPADDIYSTATETADTVANKMDKLQFDNKNLQHAHHNFSYDELLVKNNEITSTVSFYEDSTVYNKVNLTAFTDTTDYGELEATNKTGRIEFNEKDMIIPRIITKEFANDTLMSVVNGYENITNSDFINNTIISTPSTNESNSNLDLIKSNIDKIVQSDIVNIYGNLYFSFGDKQIPARFIQQSDGQINVAIDGISMCHQFQGDHTSKFMNSLCKCMIHKNCK